MTIDNILTCLIKKIVIIYSYIRELFINFSKP